MTNRKSLLTSLNGIQCCQFSGSQRRSIVTCQPKQMLGTRRTVTLLRLTGGRTLSDVRRTLHTVAFPIIFQNRNDSSLKTNHKSYSYENRDKLYFLEPTLHDFVTKNVYIKATLYVNRS